MNTISRRGLVSSALALLTNGESSVSPAGAQARYPVRPIRLIVPFAAGGVVDVVARMWADRMAGPLGTVIIENRGGASGMIGAAEVARSDPDGYTLLLGNTSTQVLNPLITPNPPYDPTKDFTAVSILANSPICIAVNPSVPAKNFAELVAYIKANPGKMSYGVTGTGTITHLAAELFKHVAGIPDLMHVPYKGGGQVLSDLIGDHIPMTAIAITNNVLALHRAGKIRILVVLSPRRLSILPDVQAASDTDPRLVASIFIGLFVPAKTPLAIIQRLGEATRKAADSADFKNRLRDAGFDPVLDRPNQAQQYLLAEHRRMAELIKALNFKLR